MIFTRSPSSYEQRLEVENLRGPFQPKCFCNSINLSLACHRHSYPCTREECHPTKLLRSRAKYGNLSEAQKRAVGWCQHCSSKYCKLLVGATAKESFKEGYGWGCVGNFASAIEQIFCLVKGTEYKQMRKCQVKKYSQGFLKVFQ